MDHSMACKFRWWPGGILLLILVLLQSRIYGADATAYGWEFSGLKEEIRSLALSADNQTIYAGTRAGFHLSRDGGQTWTQTFSDSSAEVRTISVAPNTPGKLYIGVLSAKSEEEEGLFTSSDGGQTWTKIETSLGINFFMAITLDPTDDRIIYAGTGWGIIKSEDAGETWRSISEGLAGETGDLPWVHKILIDPIDSKSIYILTKHNMIHQAPPIGPVPMFNGRPESSITVNNVRPGIYKTSNGGLSWSRLQSNIDFGPLSPADIAIMPTDTQIFYVAATLGIFRTQDGGETFEEILGDFLEFPIATTVAIDPTNGQVYGGSSGEGIYLSSNSGETWSQIFNRAPWSDGSSPYSVLISEDRKLYGGFAQGVFFKTLNENQSLTDFDDNGVTEFQDFLLFAQHFGTSVSPNRIEKRFDLKDDGKIDFQDFILFVQSFEK